jgi:Flp pilus assembly protein TadG
MPAAISSLVRRRGKRSGRGRAEAGTTALEFALLMPAFLLLFLGIIEFGRLFWMQSSLQQAVEAAARCAIIAECGTSTAAIQSYAASQMFGLTVSSDIFSVDTAATCGSGVNGEQVSASLPFTFLIPKLFPWSITLTAQSCRPN